MRRTLPAALLLYAGTLPCAALAEDFRSYATVVDVQPIFATVSTPVTRTVCRDPARSEREFTPPAASIGADIREQNRRWRERRTCTTLTENQVREEVTAYRVTYRYRGYTSTTRLAYHPGERMPVNVSLSPLP